MDILFASPGFGKPKDINFMPLVATELQKRGHSVSGVQYENKPAPDELPVENLEITNLRSPWWVGRWIVYRHWQDTMKDHLRRQKPDVVVADRVCLTPTTLAARNLDIPVVCVIPGMGFARYNPLQLGHDKTPKFCDLPRSAQIQYPFIKSLFNQNKTALNEADKVVVLSDWLRQTIRETYGCEPEIIRTPVPIDKVRASSHDREYISLVNPRTRMKGSDIFLQIAEQLSDEQFLIAGEFADEDIGTEISKLDNVTHLGWVDDMSTVYSQTEILLVPSRYEEGGPRTIVEALANGIPCLGSSRGAIGEFIGCAGEVVNDLDDPESWAKEIATIREHYSDYQGKTVGQAKDFRVAKQMAKFEHLLQSVQIQ